MKITLNDLLNAKGVSEPLQGAVKALIDRLEAAESDALEQARLNGIGAEKELALMAKLEAAEKERDTLLARIEAMEEQETPSEWFSWLPEGTTHIDKLDCYLIPHYGFKAYFKAFKYVDGVLYSYRTDSDNEYGQWIRAKPLYKEGRVPAVYPLYAQPSPQPAPSIPEGWKLVPIEPTEKMKHAGRAAAWSNAVAYNETRDIYKAMLAAAEGGEACEATGGQAMTNEQQQEFEAITRPVIEWLNANCHPHVTVLIEPTGAMLSEGIIAYTTHDYPRD